MKPSEYSFDATMATFMERKMNGDPLAKAVMNIGLGTLHKNPDGDGSTFTVKDGQEGSDGYTDDNDNGYDDGKDNDEKDKCVSATVEGGVLKIQAKDSYFNYYEKFNVNETYGGVLRQTLEGHLNQFKFTIL